MQACINVLVFTWVRTMRREMFRSCSAQRTRAMSKKEPSHTQLSAGRGRYTCLARSQSAAGGMVVRRRALRVWSCAHVHRAHDLFSNRHLSLTRTVQKLSTLFISSQLTALSLTLYTTSTRRS